MDAEILERLARIEEKQNFIIEKFDELPCGDHDDVITGLQISQEKNKFSILMAILGVISAIGGVAVLFAKV